MCVLLLIGGFDEAIPLFTKVRRRLKTGHFISGFEVKVR